MKSRRGTKGKKIKLADNEVITKIISDNNFSDLYAFTASGNMCTVSLDELPLDTKVNLSQLLNLEIGDKVTTLVSLASRQKKKNFVFITKKGMIKKSETSLYNIKRGKTMKAIKLKEGDEVVNVMLMDEGEVGILSNSGCFVRISIDDITPIGKITMGVKAIALKEGEYVIDAKEIKSSDKYLITLSKNGIVKKTSIEDFTVTNRATRGKQVSGVRDNDTITKILTIEKDCDIIIIVNKRSIKISTSEIPELSRTATGVKGINLTSGEMALDVVVSSEE
jgi:DNA gyrase subunit A